MIRNQHLQPIVNWLLGYLQNHNQWRVWISNLLPKWSQRGNFDIAKQLAIYSALRHLHSEFDINPLFMTNAVIFQNALPTLRPLGRGTTEMTELTLNIQSHF